MRDHYDFSHAQPNRHASAAQQGVSTPITRGELPPTPPSGHIQIYRDSQGDYRWRLLTTEDRVIAQAPEAYRTLADCRAAVDDVQHAMAYPDTLAPDAA